MADVLPKQLTDKQVERLSAFLLEHTQFSLMDLMGFFSVLVSSPRVVPLAEWLACLDLTKSFTSQKEAEDIISSISTLYNNVNVELREKKYNPIALTMIQESKLSADETAELLLAWLDGYFMGLELIGKDWFSTGHDQAIPYLQNSIKVAQSLSGDDGRAVTKEDFQTVQTNVKAFHDYWIAHRACQGKLLCVIVSANAQG